MSYINLELYDDNNNCTVFKGCCTADIKRNMDTTSAYDARGVKIKDFYSYSSEYDINLHLTDGEITLVDYKKFMQENEQLKAINKALREAYET